MSTSARVVALPVADPRSGGRGGRSSRRRDDSPGESPSQPGLVPAPRDQDPAARGGERDRRARRGGGAGVRERRPAPARGRAAAPAGKATDIACRVAPGGRLVAADVSPTCAELVRAALGRLRLDGAVLVQDARAPAIASSFGRVLVDAPCSGLGSAPRVRLWPHVHGTDAMFVGAFRRRE